MLKATPALVRVFTNQSSFLCSVTILITFFRGKKLELMLKATCLLRRMRIIWMSGNTTTKITNVPRQNLLLDLPNKEGDPYKRELTYNANRNPEPVFKKSCNDLPEMFFFGICSLA